MRGNLGSLWLVVGVAVVPAGATAAGGERPSAPVLEAPSAPSAPGPHSVYENPEVDLGEVVRGTTAQAIFRVRNTGVEPLKIVGVRPG